jgi:hypothetical protein
MTGVLTFLPPPKLKVCWRQGWGGGCGTMQNGRELRWGLALCLVGKTSCLTWRCLMAESQQCEGSVRTMASEVLLRVDLMPGLFQLGFAF